MTFFEPFVLALLAVGLLIVLVFIIYLIDRVNSIEKETRQVALSLSEQKKDAHSVGPYAGLSGKKLWDAMTGRVPDGLDPSVLVDVRERFEVVLHKHIEAIFLEGRQDGQLGLNGEPKNTKTITTLRGSVESWLPTSQVNSIYKCGLDTVQLPPEQWDAVRQSLDEAGQALFGKALLSLSTPLSVTLMAALSSDAVEGLPAPGA